MTADQAILFSLFGMVFAMLLWGRFRYDLVAFTALLAGVVLNVIPASAAFAGFGHPAEGVSTTLAAKIELLEAVDSFVFAMAIIYFTYGSYFEYPYNGDYYSNYEYGIATVQ